MKEKSGLLPMVLMLVFALTRLPGMLPQNFSAVYALMFCAGVYFAGRIGWWLPFGMMLVTDLGLNLYYQFALGLDVFTPGKLLYLGGNYLAYAAMLWLGRRFNPKSSWIALLGGGVLGAILFYLITNTISWFFNPFGNPEYTKTIAGWIQALTGGTAGWPQTWEFFRNTLASGGLFTGLFAGAMKLAAALEPKEEEAEESEPAAESEGEAPEEAKS
ncbi:MAG TPA: DUF6580 family putative transport protein [Verrucomicrobiae bacterium]